jgi:TonB family protein
MSVNRPRPSLASAKFTTVVQCVFLLTFLVAVGLSLRANAQELHRKLLVRVNPEYPEALRVAQISGVVRLKVTVSAGGTVTQVDIRGGNPILAEKAQQAVTKWKFAPAATQTVEEIRIGFSPH